MGAILPDPIPGHTYRAGLTLGHGGTVLGMDSAAVCFLDGWLLVQGERTTFSLKENDVRSLSECRNGVRLDLIDDSFVILKPAGVYALTLEDFDDAIRLWRTTPPPQGESVFPPATLHSSATISPRRKILSGLVLGLTALPMLTTTGFLVLLAVPGLLVGLYLSARGLIEIFDMRRFVAKS